MKKNFILVLAMMVIPTIIFSQIMYNVSKPFSYDKSGLKNISELPQIHFPVNNDGNLIEQNLKLNIKEKAVNEIIDNKFVTRMKVKVFAEKLGMMTLILDNVKLNNNSYCYVYTPDYKIVAGPVYQGSIDKYLIIKEIPTDELIIEVISNFASDFDLSIDEVDYFTKFKNKDKGENQPQERLLSDTVRDYSCSYGEVKYFENTQLITAYKCGEYGFPNNYDQFQTNYMRGVNDFQFAASRASCVIYKPLFPGDSQYNFRNHIGERGTLINFPYDDCDVNECGEGIVVGMYHNGFAGAMVNATPDFKNRVLIRFNLHHKYGTPWHLQNVNCIADSNNFKKWRETIDFSEVIDYCGASMFLYDVDGRGADIFMIKMNQKPFYKEHHIGWTTQNSITPHYKSYAIGRHGTGPTLIIYEKSTKDNSIDIIGMDASKIGGVSGSCWAFTDSIHNKELISNGLVIKLATGDTNHAVITPRLFKNTFNDYDSIKFYSESSCPINFTKIDTYLRQTKFNSIVNKNLNPNYLWMPSKDNKQKCPSTQGKISGNNYHPCNFDIANYINWNDSTKCFTIDSIPANLFPEGKLPKGYRIYHNFGDQKTIKFDPFIDNTNIEFPINACIDKCDLIYLLTLGKSNIDIAIDFYDADGRVLNNPGCDSMKYSIPFNLNLCELFDVTITKVDSNIVECTYKIDIQYDQSFCDNDQLYKKLIDASIKKYNPNVSYNYNTKKISIYSTISVMSPSIPSTYKLVFNDFVKCESIEFDYPPCFCFCPDRSPIEITMIPGDESNGCSEDQCSVSAKIDIPSVFTCPQKPYTHYSVSSFFDILFPITEDGIIAPYLNSSIACINKGEFRVDTIKLYRGLNDTFPPPPCVYEIPIYCQLYDEPQACTPDCDSIPWDDWNLELTLPNCPNCTVEASYKTRKNTCIDSLKQEIQVTKFSTKFPSSDSLSCNNCYTDEEIHAMIIKKAILTNPMGFQPILIGNESDKCDESWRVVMSSCWIEYYTYNLGFDSQRSLVRKPCDSSTCCSIGLRVCRFSGPPEYITLETVGGSGGADSCDFSQIALIYYSSEHLNPDNTVSIGYLDTIPCIEKCSWLLGINDSSYYGKRAIDEFPNNRIMIGNNCQLLTYLDNEKIECVLNNESESNNCVVRIFSLTGQSVLVMAKTIHKGINYFDLNVSELQNGLYYIQAEINGICSKFEKLIIVR